MKLNIIDKEPCKKILEIEVPQEEVQKEIEESFHQLSHSATLPGFRRGKAPMDMIRSQFTEEVKKEVREKLIQNSWKQALQDSKFKPILLEKIDEVVFSEDKPLTFKAYVEVKAPVKLGTYQGIRVARSLLPVTDAEVEKALGELQERFAEFFTVKDRVSGKGDFILIDFEGLIDGKPFPGSSVKDYFLELGSNATLPGFEDQLLGVVAREDREVQAVFPEKFVNKDLAGKKAQFKVKVKEIKEKKLAPLNDDFAKDIGGFEGLQALKDKVREGLQKEKESQARISVMEQIFEELLKTSQVEVPASLLETQLVRLAMENEQALKRQNLSYKTLGLDWPAVRKQLEPKGVNQVKISLILEAIAEKEKIEATPEEVTGRIKAYASETKQDLGAVVKEFQEKGTIQSLFENIKDEKTIDFLISKAEIKDGAPVSKGR